MWLLGVWNVFVKAFVDGRALDIAQSMLAMDLISCLLVIDMGNSEMDYFEITNQ